MNHKAKKHSAQSHHTNKVALSATLAVICMSQIPGMQKAYAAPAGADVTVSESVQQATQAITGTVLDKDGEPLIGANVQVQGTRIATVTDIDGRFAMRVPVGATLQVSYVGLETQIKKTEADVSDYNFTLEDNNLLEEVVVVGYGQQKKVNLTGSVSSVNVDKISESRPVTNVSQALAGMASGVSVVSGNNQPGNDNASINVRGVGTLNSSAPLVIIDGVEAGINTVLPQDIESMSILKDAASAAIYGSRAANGVILITTKKGKSGTMKINYNGYVSFESIRKTLTPVSNYADYMELMNEGYENSYNQKNYVFSDAVIQEWRDNEGGDALRYPNQDWIDATFKNSVATNHVVSMSGGTDKIRFYGSFGYQNNPGVMYNAGFEKFSARLSVDADVKKWLTLGIYANGYRSEMEPGARYASSGTRVDDIFTYASATTPGMVFLAPDGRYGAVNNTEDESQCAVNNPILRAYQIDGNIRKNNSRIRFVGNLHPFRGFSVVGSYSYELLDEERRFKPVFQKSWNFKDDVVTHDNTRKTNVSNYDAKVERYFWDVVAHYDKKLFSDKLEMNVMVGASSELYRSKNFNASRQDLIDLSLWALSAATGDANVSGSSTEWAMQSYFVDSNSKCKI